MSKKGFTHESTKNETKEWYTPKYIFDALGCKFDLDPCSPGKEVVPWIPAERHLTLQDDGLNAKWEYNEFVWLNPPYGSDTQKWMKRLAAHDYGIALVFSRLDTKWAQECIPSASAVLFLAGRVHFVPSWDAKDYAEGNMKPLSGCGAGSMLVGYGSYAKTILKESKLGMLMVLDG